MLRTLLPLRGALRPCRRCFSSTCAPLVGFRIPQGDQDSSASQHLESIHRRPKPSNRSARSLSSSEPKLSLELRQLDSYLKTDPAHLSGPNKQSITFLHDFKKTLKKPIEADPGAAKAIEHLIQKSDTCVKDFEQHLYQYHVYLMSLPVEKALDHILEAKVGTRVLRWLLGQDVRTWKDANMVPVPRALLAGFLIAERAEDKEFWNWYDAMCAEPAPSSEVDRYWQHDEALRQSLVWVGHLVGSLVYVHLLRDVSRSADRALVPFLKLKAGFKNRSARAITTGSVKFVLGNHLTKAGYPNTSSDLYDRFLIKMGLHEEMKDPTVASQHVKILARLALHHPTTPSETWAVRYLNALDLDPENELTRYWKDTETAFVNSVDYLILDLVKHFRRKGEHEKAAWALDFIYRKREITPSIPLPTRGARALGVSLR